MELNFAAKKKSERAWSGDQMQSAHRVAIILGEILFAAILTWGLYETYRARAALCPPGSSDCGSTLMAPAPAAAAAGRFAR